MPTGFEYLNRPIQCLNLNMKFSLRSDVLPAFGVYEALYSPEQLHVSMTPCEQLLLTETAH